MDHFRCKWIHDFLDALVWLISELDDERWETRKASNSPSR
jgi:hypothetical protein